MQCTVTKSIHLSCGAIFIDLFITNFLLRLPVKISGEIIGKSYLFFASPCNKQANCRRNINCHGRRLNANNCVIAEA